VRLEDIDLTDLDRFVGGFPDDVFTVLRRDAPVWWHPPTSHTPGHVGFWVVSSHADIRAVVSDAATFSSAGAPEAAGGGTLIEDLPFGFAAGVLLNMMDDPRHQRIRRLVTPAVAPRSLALLEGELRHRTAVILDAVVDRGSCDFLMDVAVELPLQATAMLMGVPNEDRHDLMTWSGASLTYDDRELGATNSAVQEASAAMAAYGSALIARKRTDGGDDILATVAGATIDGDDGMSAPLTDLELLMFFNLLIAAGSETTRNAIALGLDALIESPDQWHLLQADSSLISGAV
jgi:cytochrome P450